MSSQSAPGSRPVSGSATSSVGRAIDWFSARSVTEQVALAATALLGLLGAILIVLVAGDDATTASTPPAPPPATIAVAVAPSPTPTATATATPAPDCPTLVTLERLLAAADYATAFRVAQVALADPAACAGSRTRLAELTLEAGLRAIATEPARPEDPLVQQRQLDRYQTLVNLAAEHGVPLPATHRQIAADAYAASAFLLAKRAWEDALAMGEVTTADSGEVRFAVSTLRNLGEHYATAGTTAETRAEGLRYLAASCAIDRAYRLGDYTACGTLQRLLGRDERRWPAPADSPLLDAGLSGVRPGSLGQRA